MNISSLSAKQVRSMKLFVWATVRPAVDSSRPGPGSGPGGGGGSEPGSMKSGSDSESAGLSHHHAHTHPAAAVSGVYYSSAGSRHEPRGQAAPLIFSDPRGGIPFVAEPTEEPQAPFFRSAVFSPFSGAIVCFPPWAPHAVPVWPAAPSGGRASAARVSWSFNLIPGPEADMETEEGTTLLGGMDNAAWLASTLH